MFSERVTRVRFSISTLAAALMVLLLSTAAVQSVAAQSGDSSQMRGGRRPGAQQGAPNGRPMLERADDFIDKILRERLQLTDDQSAKLRAHGKRIDVDRMALRKEERDFREALRQELTPGVTPNDAKLTELMNRWPTLERKRVALQEREQKELSAFLSPVQRARFFALQDEMRRMMQEAQWRRGDKDGKDGDDRGRMMMKGDSAGRPPFRGGPGGRGGRPPRDTTKPPQ